jgi:hypothetical protein
MNSLGLPATRGQTVGEGRAFALGGEAVLGGTTSVSPTTREPKMGLFLSFESPSLTQ